MSELRNRIELPVDPTAHRQYTDAFLNWYINSKPLSKYIYYHGQGLHDTLASSMVKRLTWDYACNGRIYLFAVRDPEDNNSWLFIAQKASRRIPSLIPKRESK